MSTMWTVIAPHVNLTILGEVYHEARSPASAATHRPEVPV